MRSISLTAFLVFSIAGCAACPAGRKHEPSLTKAQVIETANRAATKVGYRINEYTTPEAHFEYADHACKWSVLYDRNDDLMPGHFSVIIDDISTEAEVFGGT